jgi:hypothetical protein
MKLLAIILSILLLSGIAIDVNTLSKQNTRCDSLQRVIDSLSLPIRWHISNKPDSDDFILYVYRVKQDSITNGMFVGRYYRVGEDTLSFIAAREMNKRLKKFQ